MNYQLVIRKRPAPGRTMRPDELFAPARRLDFASSTFYISSEVAPGEPGVPLPLPEGAALWLEQDGAPERMLLKAVGPLEVLVNGTPLPSGGRPLHSGDQLLFGEWAALFHLRRSRAGLSWRFAFLGKVALLGVAFILLAELFAATLLPFLMRRSDFFLQETRQQLVAHDLDALRKALNKAEAHTPVAKAFLDAIDEELDDRVRLLRERSSSLTAQECSRLLENLAQTRRLVEQLTQKGEPHAAALVPDLDPPVEAIVQER